MDDAFSLDARAARELVRDALWLDAPEELHIQVDEGLLVEGAVPSDGEGLVVAVGAFDGVHRGHRALVEAALSDARRRGSALVAVTFHPDPSALLDPKKPGTRLMPCADRRRALRALGASAVASFAFDEALRDTPYDVFMREGVGRLGRIAAVFVGADFRLGASGGGTVERLAALGREDGFAVQGIDLLEADGSALSASRIRALLREGSLDAAHALLGRSHYVRGRVARGRGEGRTFGFPTANVVCSAADCLPAEGVYAAYVVCGDSAWPAAVNVGTPRTFDGEVGEPFMEANLIGFSGDLYGAEVAVVFVRWLRAPKKFDSLEELERTVLGNISWTRDHLAAPEVGA